MLVVKLVRARHTFALRTVHTGTCVYVAMFVPYAVLQAVTLSQLAFLANLDAKQSISSARYAAQISSSAAFAAFFGLGFTGKVALVQMWTHIVRQHTRGSSGAPLRLLTLQSMLTSTYKACVWAVAATAFWSRGV